jgi:hypothetical protein
MNLDAQRDAMRLPENHQVGEGHFASSKSSNNEKRRGAHKSCARKVGWVVAVQKIENQPFEGRKWAKHRTWEHSAKPKIGVFLFF